MDRSFDVRLGAVAGWIGFIGIVLAFIGLIGLGATILLPAAEPAPGTDISASATERPSGFSHSTCVPAFAQARTWETWASGGLAM